MSAIGGGGTPCATPFCAIQKGFPPPPLGETVQLAVCVLAASLGMGGMGCHEGLAKRALWVRSAHLERSQEGATNWTIQTHITAHDTSENNARTQAAGIVQGMGF